MDKYPEYKFMLSQPNLYQYLKEESPEKYAELRESIDPRSVPVLKERHTFLFGEHTVEIDVYPNWGKSCILEIELSSRDDQIAIPPFITVIADVTGEKRYSNASMSRQFPEEIYL